MNDFDFEKKFSDDTAQEKENLEKQEMTAEKESGCEKEVETPDFSAIPPVSTVESIPNLNSDDVFSDSNKATVKQEQMDCPSEELQKDNCLDKQAVLVEQQQGAEQEKDSAELQENTDASDHQDQEDLQKDSKDNHECSYDQPPLYGGMPNGQPSYGQCPPYGQMPNNQPPYGQYPPYGQIPNNQPPYGQRPPYGQIPNGQPPYGQYPPYGQMPNNQPPYGQRPPYGQMPNNQPPYGQRPPYGQIPNNQPPYGQYPPYGQVPNNQPSYGQRPAHNQVPNSQPPYGQYPPYGQAPNGQPPYGQMQSGQQSPYSQPIGDQHFSSLQKDMNGGGNNVVPPVENGLFSQEFPKKNNKGPKIFIGLLIGLAAAFLIGFFVYGIWAAINMEQLDANVESSNSQITEDPFSQTDPNVEPAPGGSVTSGMKIEIQDIPQDEGESASTIYPQVVPSIVCVISEVNGASGTGSGIIASEDGYIITNAHVINNSKDTNVTVQLNDQTKYSAVIVGFDKITDLAVLKIDAEGLTPAVFGNSDQLKVGDAVLAVGSPYKVDYASSMTQGIISGLDRVVDYSDASNMTYIQTDAAISPGNSGGALVNMHGQVIGINSSKISGVAYEGVNFAIPISKAKNILDDLINQGYVSGRVRLGISGTEVSAEQQMYGYPAGVIIAKVDEESPLSKTDIQMGDIIVGIDDRTITGLDSLYQALGTYKPGDTVTLKVFRFNQNNNRGEDIEFTITLIEDKGETQQSVFIPDP